MLNWRIYRVFLAPLLLALVIAAFSLTHSSHAVSATLAPEAFSGGQAARDLDELARRFPHRRPGSTGDAALAAHVAASLRSLGGSAGSGFLVDTLRSTADTIDGRRTVETVVAEHPGSGDGAPIVVVADRDAPVGPAPAQLSGTAVLLELGRALAKGQTHRSVDLVSTSGGSGGDGGDAGLQAFLAAAPVRPDAALVLGNLAGAPPRGLAVIPFSDGAGSAPLGLEATVAKAIADQTGTAPAVPGLLGRLAHLAYPLTLGEQGPVQGRGVPAVLVQVGGEAQPRPSEPVSDGRIASAGSAVLDAIEALDGATDVSSWGEGVAQRGVPAEQKVIPEWAVSLVLLMALLPVLLTLVDGLARMRRRGQPVLRSLAWGASCAMPFFGAALFAVLLGALSIVSAAPGPSTTGLGSGGWEAILATVLVFVLAWLARGPLLRAVGLSSRPPSEGAGVVILLAGALLAFVVWLANPYAALLLIPGLHLCLAAQSLRHPELVRRPRPLLAAALVLAGLIPLALLLAYYAIAFAVGPLALAHGIVLMLAGGGLHIQVALLWSLALGAFVAMLLLALEPAEPPEDPGPGTGPFEGRELPPIRGPLSYAGPGSLGGTESALRR